MPVSTISLDGDWLLKDYPHEQGAANRPFDPASATDGWITTPVPGDIHPTLSACGRLPADISFGMNVEQCQWTSEQEWWFRRDFDVPGGFPRQKTELVFDGVDLFGTVWFNGQEIGATGNSFRPYRFDVTEQLKPGGRNTVVVRIGATTKVLESKPWQKYFACFNTPRIFARKAQCQFSWDWAPHLQALGIWRSVRIESFDSGRIMDVAARTRNDGQVTFFVTLDERAYRQDLDGRVSSRGQEMIVRPTGDLSIEITGPVNTASKAKPKPVRHQAKVVGQKNFCTLTVPKPQLWWPRGFGGQPLYHYRIRLIRNGQTHHEVQGRFAFRQVRVVEEPMAQDRLSFRFEINGEPVFCKGANWVPASCFPATVTKDRYRHLVGLAADANFNMLRIWGGGIYESEAFYDACDELGIMVWQDFMFACSDVPDDDPAFVNEVVPELEYQVKRLRNRPCVVYWCGGNEKTGSAGFKVSYGERLFHVIARGVVGELDPTRPYRPASPQSYTDLGNDQSSGDTHGGCWEKAYADGMVGWRDRVRSYQTVFNSEFGYHGPVRIESMVKFIPADKLWPINEVMEYHIQDNPYNTLPETYAQAQAEMAAKLVGDVTDVESFVKCASAMHAELLRAEIEHHRRRKWANAGAMFWMFNDCWPCASWAVVDYYLLPKPAYYSAKRCFAPVIAAIIEEAKSYDFYVVNDTLKPIAAPLAFGQGRVTGRPVWQHKRQARVPANGAAMIASIKKSQVKRQKSTYLFARLGSGARAIAATQFFHNPWREVDWPDPKLTWQIGPSKPVSPDHPSATGRQYLTKLSFKAASYARMVHLSGVEGPGVFLGDNFFDLMPGESKALEIRSDRKLNAAELRVRHWRERWDSAAP